LLHGVIDSPDIPLNVSRSYLQSDSNVKKISSHITKKVADKLAEMFQKDRKDFEEKWNDLYLFVQYGMLSDEKFAEKAKSFALVKNTEGSFFTMEEYLEKIKALQTNKSEEQIVLYTSDAEGQFSYVKQAKDRGYDVLVLDGPLASHWIQKLEQQQEKVRFSRVDSDSLDKLIDKGEEIPSKLSKSEEEKLKPLFEEAVNKEKYTVQLESMPESEAPILITQPEFIRRMMEQQRMGGGGFYGAFPEMYQLVINENHPVMSKLLKMKSPRQKETVKQLVDLAMLSQGLLKGEALTDFIHRSVNGMVES
jgi:molecular chaperone HtpG